MTRLFALAVLLAAAPASAQVLPVDPFDQHRWQAERHRLEMERLRSTADRRELTARQHALESRLNRMEIEARRQPQPYQPSAVAPLRAPETERALRQSASERRRAVAQGVGEIDAWLDRAPR